MLRHVPPASLQRLSAALWSSGWVGIEALPAQHTREVATIVLVNAALQGQLLHAALRDSWSTRLQMLVMEDEETYRYAALVACDIAQGSEIRDLDDALPAQQDAVSAAFDALLPDRLSSALADLAGGVPDLARSVAAAGVTQLYTQRRVLHPFATDVVSTSLLRLFVPPWRTPLAVEALILHSGMKSKELVKMMHWLYEAAESMLDLLQPFIAALLDWLRPERGAPVDCRCAVLQGCKDLLELAQSELEDRFTDVADQCKPRAEAAVAQDASVKVRRAAFALWLQAHALPSSVTDGDVAGLNRGPPVDLDTAALRLLAQRVEDRDPVIQGHALTACRALSDAALRRCCTVPDVFHWLHAAAASGRVRCCDDACALAVCILRPQAQHLQQRLLHAMAAATHSLARQPKERGAARLVAGMLAQLGADLLLPKLENAMQQRQP